MTITESERTMPKHPPIHPGEVLRGDFLQQRDSGGLAFDLVRLEGETPPRGPSKGRGKPPRRKAARAAHKAARDKRKDRRSRR